MALILNKSRDELLEKLPDEYDDLMLTMRIERALMKLRRKRDAESKSTHRELLAIYRQRLHRKYMPTGRM